MRRSWTSYLEASDGVDRSLVFTLRQRVLDRSYLSQWESQSKDDQLDNLLRHRDTKVTVKINAYIKGKIKIIFPTLNKKIYISHMPHMAFYKKVKKIYMENTNIKKTFKNRLLTENRLIDYRLYIDYQQKSIWLNNQRISILQRCIDPFWVTIINIIR